MKRGRSTGTPTKAQQARFDAIKHIGCIACRECGIGWAPAEIHHLTVGGKHGQKRRGHDFTVGLCCFHHRGEPLPWQDKCGPSYALQPRAFRERFGQDDVLLEKQNALIGEYENALGAADALMGVFGLRRVNA